MNPMSLLTLPRSLLWDAAQQGKRQAPSGERRERTLGVLATLALAAVAGALAWAG